MPDDAGPRQGGPAPKTEPTGWVGDIRVVAGFRLLRQVGEGGMSTVYLSYDVPGRRAVAVKLLADHLAARQEFVNRFYREARLSRVLHHPNIVRGFGAGFDSESGKHFLVLEFIDGPSAHTALTRLGQVPVGVVVQVGIDIARALHFLHSRNYVHRDVKPDNILLPPNGPAKLADLGLTKRLADDTHLTALSQGVGTSYYMPYEQALNAALVDGRSDVFALGATLYHLLTGHVPFPGTTHEEIIEGKEHDASVPAHQLNPAVPRALSDIIRVTLARDPRARYQHANDLARALEATGLAAAIPAFSSVVSPGEAEHSATPALDAPTRADLIVRVPVLSPEESDSPSPVGPSPLPENDKPRFQPPDDASGHRPAALAIGAVLVALGLQGAAPPAVTDATSSPRGQGPQPLVQKWAPAPSQ